MKGEDIFTGKKVAIKLVKKIFNGLSTARAVVGEIQIMNQLSQMKNNFFTPELIDIILVQEGEEEHLFIVMELVQSDLKKVLTTTN